MDSKGNILSKNKFVPRVIPIDYSWVKEHKRYMFFYRGAVRWGLAFCSPCTLTLIYINFWSICITKTMPQFTKRCWPWWRKCMAIYGIFLRWAMIFLKTILYSIYKKKKVHHSGGSHFDNADISRTIVMSFNQIMNFSLEYKTLLLDYVA